MKTRLATLCATLFAAATISLLNACAKQERVREIDWAKAALARNPAFEIVATDDNAGVFTVRDTSTGTMRTLRLEDLIAAPLPPRSAASSAAAAPLAATAAPTSVAAPAPVSTPALVEAPAQTLADVQTTETVKAGRTGDQPLADGPGYSITRGSDASAANDNATLEGPGYSISHSMAHDEPTQGSARPNAEAVASNVEKRTDPIICQGDRLMRIDGETIEFTGDALIVEKGCDLYISNTNIRAGGVGIIARQARVHIVNSSIGGTRGSYEASEGAEIYVARSTFTGVGRRFDSATMNDLGGNAYQTQ